MQELNFILDGQSLKKSTGFPDVVEKSANYLEIVVDGVPEGYNLSCYFEMSWEDGTVYDVHMPDGRCTIPEYCTTLPERVNQYIDYVLSVSVAGFSSDGKRFTTNKVPMIIDQTAYNDTTTNTPEIPESQIQRLEDAVDLANQATESANSAADTANKAADSANDAADAANKAASEATAVAEDVRNSLEAGEFKGEPGDPPYIGDNGNWFVFDKTQNIYVDSGVAAQGKKGDTGEKGEKGETPYIGENGNWYIYDKETEEFIDSGFPSGGGGTVSSINGISPDENKNITLVAEDVGALSIDGDYQEETQIVISNARENAPITSLIAYGESTQESDPAPDSPVDIVSEDLTWFNLSGINLFPGIGLANDATINIDGENHKYFPEINDCTPTSDGFARFYYDNSAGTSRQLARRYVTNQVYNTRTYPIYDNSGNKRKYKILIEVRNVVSAPEYIYINQITTATPAFDSERQITSGNIVDGAQFIIESSLIDNPEKASYFLKIYAAAAVGGIADLEIRVSIFPAEIESPVYEPYDLTSYPVTVNDSLRGLKVESGGNFTDSSGQQWVCDTYDVVTGEYVQRVRERVMNSQLNYALHSSELTNTVLIYTTSLTDRKAVNSKAGGELCSHLPIIVNDNLDAELAFGASAIEYKMWLYFRITKQRLAEYGLIDGDTATYVPAVKAWLAAQEEAGTPLTVLYQLEEPIVTNYTPHFIVPHQPVQVITAGGPNIGVTYNDASSSAKTAYDATLGIIKELHPTSGDGNGTGSGSGSGTGDGSDSELEARVSVLETDVSNVKSTVGELESSVTTLETDVGNVETSVKNIELLLPSYLSVADGGGAHNSIYRGKYLGDAVTTEQFASIADGSFKDMFIGDYWTIDGKNYQIAAFNYYLWCAHNGSNMITAPHVTIVPSDEIVAKAPMNTETISSGTMDGFYLTTMATTTLASVDNYILPLFNNKIMYVLKSMGGLGTTKSLLADLLRLENIVGGNMYTTPSTLDGTQLPLFRLSPSLIYWESGFWLRNYYAENAFWMVTKNSFGNHITKSTTLTQTLGVRPIFSIMG